MTWAASGQCPAQGETFTTGNNASGYFLDAISVKSTYTESNQAQDNIRIGTISGTTITPVYTFGPSNLQLSQNNQFMVFTFGSVLLQPNTMYGFDIKGLSIGGLQIYNAVDETAYTGGYGYNSGDGNGPTSTINPVGADRVFHLNISAAPEPASLSLVGLGATALIKRRRA